MFLTLLRWAARLGIAAAVVIGLLIVVVRFADGPLGPIPGGPLRVGEWVQEEDVDWTFIRDVREVELQLEANGRSRTTWALDFRGELYIPCGSAQSVLKQWPKQAMEDGRAVVRARGRRYSTTALRVHDIGLHQQLTRELEAKYGGGASFDPESYWIFRMIHRPGPAE